MNAWVAKTKAEKRRIKLSAQTYVRSTVRKVVHEVARVSPQFTGNYVVNWQLETTSHKSAYTSTYSWSDWRKVPNRLRMSQGANPAAGVMIAENEQIIANLRYNSKIELWNNAPVADSIEAGAIDYRSPQNTKYDLTNGLVPYLLAKRGFGFLKKV